MERLKQNWLTEDLIDFEFKKYTLLAYLQHVKKRFEKVELYPSLGELQFHYINLLKFKDGQELMRGQFPKTLKEADFQQLKLNYEILVKDDEVMNQLKEIIEFAEPSMERVLEEGKGLYEFVEEDLEISPVGLSSLYEKEGYLLINRNAKRDVSVYRYQVSIFQNSGEQYRGINTTYLEDDFRDYSRSYEKIKLDLAKKFSDLPNPATFLVASKLDFPINETLLPVAKRVLIKTLDFS